MSKSSFHVPFCVIGLIRLVGVKCLVWPVSNWFLLFGCIHQKSWKWLHSKTERRYMHLYFNCQSYLFSRNVLNWWGNFVVLFTFQVELGILEVVVCNLFKKLLIHALIAKKNKALSSTNEGRRTVQK